MLFQDSNYACIINNISYNDFRHFNQWMLHKSIFPEATVVLKSIGV